MLTTRVKREFDLTASAEGRDAPFHATIKFFDSAKGYGFAVPDDPSITADVFIHISELTRAGLSSLNAGERISYEPVARNGRMRATMISVLS